MGTHSQEAARRLLEEQDTVLRSVDVCSEGLNGGDGNGGQMEGQ